MILETTTYGTHLVSDTYLDLAPLVDETLTGKKLAMLFAVIVLAARSAFEDLMPAWLMAAMTDFALGPTPSEAAGDGGVSVLDKMAMSMMKATVT